MAKKSKDELQRLELEEQIAEAIKRSTANLDSFVDAQKKIVENYKLIKKINLQIQAIDEEIAELEGQTTKEAQERLKYLVASKSALEQDVKLIIKTNKELSTTKNLAKSIGGSLLDWGKSLKSQFIPSLGDVFNKFLSLNDLAVQTSVNIGLSGQRMGLMVKNIEASQEAWGILGFDLESSAKFQQSISDELGRQVILSQQSQQLAANTARALNMEASELGGLVGQMEQFGLGTEQSLSMITQMRIESEEMGVNSGKVIKKFQQNLGLMNKLNFKNGVKGMMDMAKFSEKYKLDMNSVASVADKVFRPEGAIEAAAQLQVLGGSLAQLGDPFQLMYKARNSPEELAKSLTKAATASATFDKATGEWKVNAYELDRLKEAASALGMDYGELVNTAKQTAKINMFEGLLSGKGLDKKQMDMLSGMMEMSEKGATIDGKLVSEMSPTMLKELTDHHTDLQNLQKDAQTAQKELEGIKNLIMTRFVAFFTENKQLILDFLSGLKSFLKKMFDIFSPTGLMATVLGLYFGGKVLWPFIQGKIFGAAAAKSFNAGTALGKQGSILKPTADKKALLDQVKQMKSQNPGMGTKEALDKIRGSNMSEQTKQMDELGKSTSKLGGISSMSAPQILALSVAILAVGAAIGVAAFGLSYLVEAFKGLTGEQVLGALGALVIVMGGMALMLYLLTTASVVAAVPLLAVGAAFLMIGGAIALASWGLSVLVDSFTNMFKVIGDNGTSLILAGIGFMSMAAGIGMLSISLLALAGTSLLALPGLLMLGAATSMLTETATALSSAGGGEGIAKTVNAINSVDENKLNALKDLATWMALLGGTTTIKFDENLHVDGSIDLKGKDGSKMEIDFSKLTSIQKAQLTEIVFSTHPKGRNGYRES